MQIKWYGHSCFLFTSNTRVRVLTDPFNEKVGYQLPRVEADIVTTSHEHYDHNNVKIVKGNFTYINQLGKFSQNGVAITGIPTFHDNENGVKKGKNTVYKFTIDGMDLCHCGDLGHVLTKEQVSEIGPVDVLLVPVGGFYSIDATAAAEVVKQLKPQIIIPMHYRTKAFNPSNLAIDGVNKFLTVMGGGKKLERQEIQINQADLEKYAGVVVLEYAND